MKKKKDRETHINQQIAKFLLDFDEEFQSDHYGFLSFQDGEHFHHRLRDGKVEVCQVSGVELGRLEHFLDYWDNQKGEESFQQLEAKLAAGGDINAIETTLRGSAMVSALKQFKQLLEVQDKKLPIPNCSKCGKQMKFEEKRGKKFTSLLGEAVVIRKYRYCRRCKLGLFPLDKFIGMERKSITPGLERMVLSLTAEVSSYRGKEMLEELSGVNISRSRVDRLTRKSGAEIADSKPKNVKKPKASLTLPVVTADEAGVPAELVKIGSQMWGRCCMINDPSSYGECLGTSVEKRTPTRGNGKPQSPASAWLSAEAKKRNSSQSSIQR